MTGTKGDVKSDALKERMQRFATMAAAPTVLEARQDEEEVEEQGETLGAASSATAWQREQSWCPQAGHCQPDARLGHWFWHQRQRRLLHALRQQKPQHRLTRRSPSNRGGNLWPRLAFPEGYGPGVFPAAAVPPSASHWEHRGVAAVTVSGSDSEDDLCLTELAARPLVASGISQCQ